MNILADENLDATIVQWLRSAGHDVTYVAECEPNIADEQVLAMARGEDRVIVTSDLDFGDLIVRTQSRCAGLLILRLRVQSTDARLRVFQNQWNAIAHRLAGSLIIVTDSRARIRPMDF